MPPRAPSAVQATCKRPHQGQGRLPAGRGAHGYAAAGAAQVAEVVTTRD
eukprot:CAMPEP_0175267080 /NCGR_PEP_ID=MMETSP0093-20121207/43661_1 /TAXON_ID=311494 /ORGANISM="Alexandrium monilatum, Strain CCMP3105" /LENGTH=48 /DNA_ID= /DNA_START= /DNA_END= /DNA_ORIENTATION=